MTFTDDDLAEWKSHIKADYERLRVDPDKLKALLARMEAAERVCSASASLLEEIESGHMDWRVVRSLARRFIEWTLKYRRRKYTL